MLNKNLRNGTKNEVFWPTLFPYTITYNVCNGYFFRRVVFDEAILFSELVFLTAVI